MRKRVLAYILLPLILVLFVSAVIHYSLTRYFIHQAKEDLMNILLSNRGFHQYIQKVLHPAFFEGMREGKIAKDYYDPKLLSSSYIVRTMHGLYNEERKKDSLKPVYYKMAAINPRNPVNRADELEERLIRLFNDNPGLEEHEEIVRKEGKKYLYYAIPFLRNEQRCLRCHGSPEDAPPGLRSLYPGESGFHEKVGEVRAIESMRIPVQDEGYLALMTTGAAGSGLFAIVVLFFFNTGLRQQVAEKTRHLEAEIAERVRSEEETRASEDNFRTLFNQAADATLIVSEAGEILDANEVACARYQYSKEELTSMNIARLNRDRGVQARLEETSRKGVLFAEVEHLAKDGTVIPTEVSARYVKKNGTGFIIATYRDVTERKKAEAAIRTSEANFRALFDKSADAQFMIRLDGAIIGVNEVACSRYRYSKDELLKMYVTQIDSPETSCYAAERIAKIDREGSAIFCAEHVAKDGTLIPNEVNATMITRGDEPVLLATCRDISERKKAEEAVAAEKERLAVTLRSIGDGVIVTDTSGAVTLINKVAEELTGWPQEEACGMPLEAVFRIINEATREKAESPTENVIRTGLIVGLANHTALIRKDGTEIVIADSAAPIRDKKSEIIGVVLVFRDITAQYRMEQEMQKLQKLESLGVLAGGLAHDFNNLLTSIIGNISIAKMQLGVDSKSFQRLTEAERAAQRATDLTHQLLTFAKGGAPIKKLTSLSEIAKEAIGFALSGSNVRCMYAIPAGLWSAEVDKGQMNQVFNNLIINAIQAMPEGGTVRVVFENRTVGKDDVGDLQAGHYIKVEFSDEGTGIPGELLGKIFDPYFTTKKSGSGLGLSTVYSIVKRHEGGISVRSSAGAGTTFTLYIPAVKDSVKPEQEEASGVLRGKGKVLVMDDEELVRTVAGEILSALGYEVGLAKDGAEAIALYEKEAAGGKPFDIVIMDLTVPGGIGGKEAIVKLRELDRNAKVIVSSGYSVDPIMADYKKYGFCGVISKPYNANQLSEVIRRVL